MAALLQKCVLIHLLTTLPFPFSLDVTSVDIHINRAVKEAEEINATRHPVLRYVGGRISPEMEPPKLLWLKRHLKKECWGTIGHVMDLADYLTYRATGDTTR